MDPRSTSAPRKPVEGPRVDPAHAVYTGKTHPLDAMFKPDSVAVIGASERVGSVGRTILWNLLSSPFGGAVYPVNPTRRHVLGIQAFPSIKAIPDPVSLAVITTPAATVPGIVGECVAAGVPAAIVLSAGFREQGEQGLALEAEITRLARGRMRIVGPNCLGVMNPVRGLNATFALTVARPGNVAFLSQSGALCTAVLDWSLRELVGFSAFVSTGSMLDVGWGDLINYFGDDPSTQSILIYMESVGDARAFLSAAREVSLTKPIIVIKAGRTAEAASAAASHTGALTGSDEVLEAAFRRVGVLRVAGIADIFYMAEVLAKQPRPTGNRLAIVTNAGGPGVIATDALIGGGGALAHLTPETRAALDAFLPSHWSHGNPVDILGDADPDRYSQAIDIVAKDPGADGLLVIMTPQGMTHPTHVAERLRQFARTTGKPLLASWMGGTEVSAGEAVLNHAGIPSFPFPDTAVRAFNYMWRYSYNLRGLYETPSLRVGDGDPQREAAAAILGAARAAGRTLLAENESKALLATYGIPVVPTVLARTGEEAGAAARQIGFPVTVKLHSETLTHKSDVGGVKLDLESEDQVRAAFDKIKDSVTTRAGAQHFDGVTVQPMVRRRDDGYELILGSSVDAQFGPVLLFGAGGQMVEVFMDRALALPPLNSTLARRMMEQTRIWKALLGIRGRAPIDVAALEQLLVRFSALVVENPRIKEIDVNPLYASPDGLIALDARVVLHPPELADASLPPPAIRPYPIQYVTPWTTKSGMELLIRPIRPEDEPLMIRFHEQLSERTVYLRFFSAIKLSQRTAHERLTRICFVDYDREMVLVAVRPATADGEPEILAVGRLSKEAASASAEIAALVRDDIQHQGIGSELYRRLLQFARDDGLASVHSVMLRENREMRAVCERLGFTIKTSADFMDDTIDAELVL